MSAKQVGQLPKKNYQNEIFGFLLQFFIFFSIYYIYFGRYYLTGEAIFIGDSHGSISLNNLASHTINKYHEFLWWDPSTLNGWPAYINLTIGWFNYLNPFSLLSNLINWLLVNFSQFSTAAAVQIQFSIVTYAMILCMVLLLSRLLIVSNIARFIPPLIFTLGASTDQIHKLIHHGPPLIPALFYLYGLFYFFYDRSQKGLYVFLVSLIVLISSINYIFMSSSIFPISIFTIFFLIFNKNFVLHALKISKNTLNTHLGRLIFMLIFFTIILGLINLFLPMHFLYKEIIRLGPSDTTHPFSFATNRLEGLMSGGYFNAQFIFVGLNMWAPFDDIYTYALNSIPSADLFIPKVDMRYIGIFTFPLILTSFFISKKSYLVLPLFLTYFVCSFVLPYSFDFNLFKYISDVIPVMKNIRAMPHMMPRDMPLILVAFISGITFEGIIKLNFKRVTKTITSIYFSLLIFNFIIICTIFVSSTISIKHSISHIAIYSIFFLILLIVIPLTEQKKIKTHLGIVFIVLAFTDLSISSSYYWGRTQKSWGQTLPSSLLPNPEHFSTLSNFQSSSEVEPKIENGTLILGMDSKPFQLSDGSKVARSNKDVWVQTPDQSYYATPWAEYAESKKLNPIPSFKQSNLWYGDYKGYVHGGTKSPWFGLRTWLVLYTRPAWHLLLENLDFESGNLIKYPVFHFYNSATFVPFEKIYEIDKIAPPSPTTTFYIHNSEALRGLSSTPMELKVNYKILDFTPNRVKISASMPEEGFLYYLDTFDKFWEATVNNEPTKVYRANFNFKAIRLPAGACIVEWIYNPYPIKYGWIAFYILFLLLLGLMGYSILGNRIKPSTPTKNDPFSPIK
ncbi:MAG: hypothetical protein ACD_37C00664G0008, partial [uncultured bacterium]